MFLFFFGLHGIMFIRQTFLSGQPMTYTAWHCELQPRTTQDIDFWTCSSLDLPPTYRTGLEHSTTDQTAYTGPLNSKRRSTLCPDPEPLLDDLNKGHKSIISCFLLHDQELNPFKKHMLRTCIVPINGCIRKQRQ